MKGTSRGFERSFVFQSLSRRGGARRAQRDLLTNRALQDYRLYAGWISLCALFVPAAKPRLASKDAVTRRMKGTSERSRRPSFFKS